MAGMDADDREFMRELLRRHEKSSDAMIAGFKRVLRRFDAETERVRKHTRQMEEDHREFVAELRAQRAALFRVLDRLDEGPAGAGA
jgi:phage shock protein A